MTGGNAAIVQRKNFSLAACASERSATVTRLQSWRTLTLGSGVRSICHALLFAYAIGAMWPAVVMAQVTTPTDAKQPGDNKSAGKNKSADNKSAEPPASQFTDSASNTVATDAGLFFGFATINGREVSSAGMLRFIGFKQFPGELTKANLVYRFQQADMVEGAMFGVLQTNTVRPLDLKRRRLQLEIRGSYLPYAARADQGLGGRLTGSYTDQFETRIGKIGIALGALVRDAPQPREYYEAGTAYRPCNSVGDADTCTYDPNSNDPLYYATPSGTFRQERVTEKLSGYFGALQWQPSDRLDLNFDFERSRRLTERYRGELGLTDASRGIVPLEIADNGRLLRWAGESGLDLNAFKRRRDETYTGGGLSGRYRATDRLSVFSDLSYSETYRLQNDTSATLVGNDMIGPDGLIPYTLDQRKKGIPSIEFGRPLDLSNYDAFTLNPAARRGLEARTDRIWAGALDATYKVGGPLTELKVGLRYSDHRRDAQLQTFLASGGKVAAEDAAAGRANCRIDPIVDNWADQSITNIQRWPMYDPTCLFAAFAGTTDPNTTLSSRTGGGIHARERILAGYVMGKFQTGIAGVPVDGNVGLRTVLTKTETRVYRFTDDPADLDGVRDTVGPVVDLLPSLNVSAMPDPQLRIRAGIYRTLQRSNIEGLGLRRIIQGPAAVFDDRPRPLRAWNTDLVFEYAANKDTAFLLALNYKLLSGSAWPADVLISGGPALPPELRAASKRGSYIRGFEIGINRTFRSLPVPFKGLGLKASYAFTESNFHFADPTAVDKANPLYNFTPPAGVPALSKHVVVLDLDYKLGSFAFGVSYIYRSGYFRPTGLTPNRSLSPNTFVSLTASYDLTEHIQLLFLAANLTNQSESYVRPVADSVGQTAYAGRVFSAALRLRY